MPPTCPWGVGSERAGLGGRVNSGPHLGLNAGCHPQPITGSWGRPPEADCGRRCHSGPAPGAAAGHLEWERPQTRSGQPCPYTGALSASPPPTSACTPWGAGRSADEPPGWGGQGARCPGEPGSRWAAGCGTAGPGPGQGAWEGLRASPPAGARPAGALCLQAPPAGRGLAQTLAESMGAPVLWCREV